MSKLTNVALPKFKDIAKALFYSPISDESLALPWSRNKIFFWFSRSA